MNHKIGGTWGPLRAGVLAVVAAVAVLATGCVSRLATVSVSGGPAAFPQVVVFARCMRSHGVPNFPDPPAIGQGSTSPANGAGIDPKSPQFQAALRACHHVLPAGVHLRLHMSVGVQKP